MAQSLVQPACAAVVGAVVVLFFAKPAAPTWGARADAATARADAPDERVPGAVA